MGANVLKWRDTMVNGEHKLILNELKTLKNENRASHSKIYTRLLNGDKKFVMIETNMKFYKRAVLGLYVLSGSLLIVLVRSFLIQIIGG